MRRDGTCQRLVPSWLLVLGVLGACIAPAADAPDLLRLRVQRTAEPAVPLADVLGDARAIVPLLATYCAPCRAEVPAANRAARRGLRVVGIFVDVEDARGLARSEEWASTSTRAGCRRRSRTRLPGRAPGLPASFFVRGSAIERHDRILEDAQVDGFLAEGGGGRR
jgi:hypothetical protein